VSCSSSGGPSSEAVSSIIIAKDAGGNQEILAGSNSGHIYKSVDIGNTWTNSISGAGIYALASSPNYASDHTLFAASAFGYNVFKSTDSGQSWTDISRWWESGGVPFLGHWSLAVSPNYINDHTIFICGNTYGVYRRQMGEQTGRAKPLDRVPVEKWLWRLHQAM